MDRDAAALDPELLAGLRALVDQHRLRIVGRAAASPVDAETLATELRLPVGQVRRHLEVLLGAGLVETRGGPEGRDRFGARLDRVGAMGRGLAALERSAHGFVDLPGGAWPHDGESLAETLARLEATPDEARTLRAYLVDGRLTTIPAQAAKRDIVLRFLLERVFTEDREYPEKEVNQRLALFHPDVAALRRYLYDAGYVDRDHGLYRRARPRV
jgi:DNA-binding MarR family transcriptional regulator